MRGLIPLIATIGLAAACDSGPESPDTSVGDPVDGGARDAGAGDVGFDDAAVADAGSEDAGRPPHPVWQEITPERSDSHIEGDRSALVYDYALPPGSGPTDEIRVFTTVTEPVLARIAYSTTGDRLLAFVNETTVRLHEAELRGQGVEVSGEVLLDLRTGDTFGFVLAGGAAVGSGSTGGTLSVSLVAWKPIVEPDLIGNKRYLEAEGVLPIGDGTVQTFNLHVQQVRKVDGQWTDEAMLEYDDGRSPRKVLEDTAYLWAEMYRDLIARGMAQSEIEKLAQSIQAPGEESGVYIETELGACGYSGAPRTITCGAGTSTYTKGTMLHESVHGWEWLTFNDVHPRSILFRDAFSRFANLVYHTRQSEPEKLSGDGWRLDYLNYGLQNSVEWGSEMARDWAYGTRAGGWPGNWQFASQHAPAFATFFDCLWLEGRELEECKQVSFGSGPLMRRPERAPEDIDIPVAGFTAADSEAIWNVCRGQASPAEVTHFDGLIRQVAPELPGSPAAAYRLAVGDCNHDGVEDWLCWYTGPGPGGSPYLWNRENTEGAYTFIVSGKTGDRYAEYVQDPFLTLPSINGSLAQPMYREWQGQYGSCNGALRLDYMTAEWITAYFGDLLD